MSPFIMWAILGLISGILAKILMPGKDKGGLISTILLGVGGAFLGGYLGTRFGITVQTGDLSIISFATAIGGALVLLVAFRLLKVLV